MSETKTRQVIVGGVETKSGETGDRKWRRYSLKDPDDKFVASTFSGTIGKFLQEHEGKRIEVDIEEKEGRDGGTLRDLMDAREVTSAAAASPNGSAPAGGFVGGQERHEAIAREVAVKAAVDLVTGRPEDFTDLSLEGVLIVANKLAAYILNGPETPAAE